MQRESTVHFLKKGGRFTGVRFIVVLWNLHIYHI